MTGALLDFKFRAFPVSPEPKHRCQRWWHGFLNYFVRIGDGLAIVIEWAMNI
jgi:hypothetical protein